MLLLIYAKHAAIQAPLVSNEKTGGRQWRFLEGTS